MDYRPLRLSLFPLCIFALLLSFRAEALFVDAQPPAGFGGSPGAWTHSGASRATSFYPGGFLGPGPTVNVGGRMATLPASYRFAANAGRFAARGLWLNPAIGVTAGVASWLVSECLESDGSVWYITCGPETGVQSDGYQYSASNPDGNSGWQPSPQAACSVLAEIIWGNMSQGWLRGTATASTYGKDACLVTRISSGVGVPFPEGYVSTFKIDVFRRSNSDCPAGWYHTDQGCTQAPQPKRAGEQDLIDKLGNIDITEIPETLPANIPGPWPVEQPVINPLESNPSVPNPQPMFVPTGLPVPAPEGSPEPYYQPGVEVTPAPTPSSPWRVDVQPVDRPQSSPEPMPDPIPVAPVDPATGPGVATGGPGFCEQNPDSIACLPVDSLDAESLPDEQLNIDFSPDSGWQSVGTCPAPRTITVSGVELSFGWDLFCDFAEMIRPVIVGFAWFSAALLFYGYVRSSS